MICRCDTLSDAKGRCIVRIKLTPKPDGCAGDEKANDDFRSPFLQKPVDLIFSSPSLLWRQSLSGGTTKLVNTIQVYCGTNRVLNSKKLSFAAPPTPPAVTLASFAKENCAKIDIESDVRAMLQPGDSPKRHFAYVYAGFADSDCLQKMPRVHSIYDIFSLMQPLYKLQKNGSVYIPVTMRALAKLSEGCPHKDPIIAEAYSVAADKVLKLQFSRKKKWLSYLLKESRCAAAIAFASFACQHENIEVVLVPSIKYFIANFIGSRGDASAKRRKVSTMQIYFGDVIANIFVSGDESHRFGSRNTIHVTTRKETDLYAFSCGDVREIVVDGETVAVPSPTRAENLWLGCDLSYRGELKTWDKLKKVFDPFAVLELIANVAAAVSSLKQKSNIAAVKKKVSGAYKVYVDLMCIEYPDKEPQTELNILLRSLPDVLGAELDKIFKKSFNATGSEPSGAIKLRPMLNRRTSAF